MRQSVGSRTVKAGSKSLKLDPFEDAVHLQRVVRFNINNQRIGAFLNQKSKNSYQLVFGFSCKGVHTSLRMDQVEPIFEGIEAGLKDFPQGETLTIHSGSFRDDSDRQAQLERIIQEATQPELQFLKLSEQARTRQLTSQGRRKPCFLNLYSTWTLDSTVEGADWMEKFIALMIRFAKKTSGSLGESERQDLNRLLRRAYDEGFLPTLRLLTNKMGLDVKAMDESNLWSNLWNRFNRNGAADIPQLLIYTENQPLREEVRSQWHATSRLLDNHPPQAHREWVKVRGDNYIGILTVLEKPGGWTDKWSQLRYLWDITSRGEVFDTEVFSEIQAGNPSATTNTMQLLLKQSNNAAGTAAKHQSIDVAAQIKTKRAVEAQQQMFEGSVPLVNGLLILVHRPSPEELTQACAQMESYFRRPMWVVREREIAWRLWLQTLPIVSERILAAPFDRRLTYFSDEVAGLLPLVQTHPCDRSGLELIAHEGGTPLYLDLVKDHRNLALFGTTRSGKSVVVSGILLDALASGVPVVAMDFPKPDGSSTFTDFTKFVKGSYFDISSECNNLFEKPDLRKLSEKERQKRSNSYFSFLTSALLTMVVGDAEDKMLAQSVRSILSLALKSFFDDTIIAERYRIATSAPYGTKERLLMPTLHDFLPFCSEKTLDMRKIRGDTERALERIDLRLNYWLTSSVGNSISKPSSFDIDSPLLVFALTNLDNEEDAAILGLSALSASLRKALSSEASIFFVDEAPILFEYVQLSNLVARLCANGAKAGVRVIVSAQDPDTIARAPAASKIFQNLSTKLIGRIQPIAVDSFVNILKYPRETIVANATESFFPAREGLYSNWLLDDNGKTTRVRFYPSEELLAVVANNPPEQAARTRFLEYYENPYQAISEFARYYSACIREGRGLISGLNSALPPKIPSFPPLSLEQIDSAQPNLSLETNHE
jgi:hypothetical protein